MLFVVVRYESISLHESKDGRPNHVKVKTLQDFGFQLANLSSSDCVVNHLEDCLQLLRIDLLIFPGDMQRRYPKTLQVSFLKVSPPHEGLVNNTNCDIESFRPHLKFIVQLRQPINKILPIFVRDLSLEFFIL